MVRPGQLDQRIAIQDFTLAADGGGGLTKAWADLATDPDVWASVKAGGGGESTTEDRTNATAMTTFVIRNRSDIDERMRIVWEGLDYNIRHVMREGSRAMYLTILAERGVSN